ncbi:MAG: hypothetical protein V1756_00030 [Patescibacteria group bacterium]
MNQKFLLPGAIVIAVILIVGAVFYTNKGGMDVLSPQDAAAKAINYINQIVAAQGVTSTASLITVSEENGNYKFDFTLEDREYTSYITKNGNFLFPDGYDLSTTTGEESNGNSDDETSNVTCDDVAKKDKATLEAFVVSKCPYGLQMQRVLYELVKNIPSLAENIKVEYIGAVQAGKIISMHGDVEAQENLRQICIREEQQLKYWDYVSCYIQQGDMEGCLTSAGIDKAKLNACTTDAAKGLAYAQTDFTAQGNYQVTGSPTLFLNGEKVSEFNFGGRTAEALKTLLCCGFEQTVGVCSQNLSTTSAAVGFSATYGSTGGTTSGGCE